MVRRSYQQRPLVHQAQRDQETAVCNAVTTTEGIAEAGAG